MAEWIDAENDQDAIRQAQVLKQDARKCEVWEGNRFVAELDSQDLVASFGLAFAFVSRASRRASFSSAP